MVSLHVDGVAAAKVAVQGVEKRLRSELEAAVEAEAEAVVVDAQGNVRQDSGDLHDSIAAEVDGDTATVAPRPALSDVDDQRLAIKANVNEYGRSRDPGRPFMGPASELSRQRWPKRAKDAARRAAEG